MIYSYKCFIQQRNIVVQPLETYDKFVAWNKTVQIELMEVRRNNRKGKMEIRIIMILSVKIKEKKERLKVQFKALGFKIKNYIYQNENGTKFKGKCKTWRKRYLTRLLYIKCKDTFRNQLKNVNSLTKEQKQ